MGYYHANGRPRSRCGRLRGATRSPTISSWLPLGVRTSIISGWPAPARRNIPMPTRARRRNQIAVVESTVSALSSPITRRNRDRRHAEIVRDGAITPDSMPSIRCSPPISRVPTSRRKDGDPALADSGQPTTLPPLTDQTIGDLLSAKGIGWAWYGGAWQATLDGTNASPAPIFSVSSPALQLFRRHGAGQHRAGRAPPGWRPRRRRIHSRRSTPAPCRRSASTSLRAT